MQRILIANRGEIARRVIRTARRMGIETVAIYSDIDADALHVLEADVAFRLPGVTPRETYLDIERILEVARKSGADAVHPGYGFLSENALFAARCAEQGLVFIGPSATAIEQLGSKTAARRMAIEAEVPVMPGSRGAVATLDEVRSIAEEIGYPVLLKAAAGGGGKGMRVVRSASELEEGWRSARGEAMTAFNSDEVFVEKYVEKPRHIELQILADHHGNVVVLGERECSIQRRHQKVIEESPSVAVDEALRQRMFEAGERLVRAASYSNAGTLEFLLDEGGAFYFLEVNTRLQVEHPVTEMVTGIDLVEQQIRIARGEKLQMTTGSIERSGWSIECRICAEDVYNGFVPSTGRVTELREPEGAHVRVDSGMQEGMVVSPYYDPMLAKLVVHGSDRTDAIGRMLEALEEYHVAGISTTIPFCRAVLRSEPFRSGNFSTAYVREEWSGERPLPDPEELRLAVAAAVRTLEGIEERISIPHN